MESNVSALFRLGSFLVVVVEVEEEEEEAESCAIRLVLALCNAF